MANVSGFLQQLLNARYGKDVRQAIHDSIREINKQVEESDTSALASAQAAQTAATEAKNAVNNIGTTVDEHIKKQTNIVTDDNFGEKANAYLTEKLYPILENEIGVVNTRYEYGDVRRYGAIGDGVTDDTRALEVAFKNAKAYKTVIKLEKNKTYIMRTGAPLGTYSILEGNGATILVDRIISNTDEWGENYDYQFFTDNGFNGNIKIFDWKDVTINFSPELMTKADGTTDMQYIFRFYDCEEFRMKNVNIIADGDDRNAINIFTFCGHGKIFMDNCNFKNTQRYRENGSILWIQSRLADGYYARIYNCNFYCNCWDEIVSLYSSGTHDIVIDGCTIIKEWYDTYYNAKQELAHNFLGFFVTNNYLEPTTFTKEEVAKIYHNVIYSNCKLVCKPINPNSAIGILGITAHGNCYETPSTTQFVNCDIDIKNLDMVAKAGATDNYTNNHDWINNNNVIFADCNIKLSNFTGKRGIARSNSANLTFKNCQMILDTYIYNQVWNNENKCSCYRLSMENNKIRINNANSVLFKVNPLARETFRIVGNDIIATDENGAYKPVSLMGESTSADGYDSTAVVYTHSENANYNFYSFGNRINSECLEKQVEESKTSMGNVLYKKKWVACGDSFTHGEFTGYVDSAGKTGMASDAYDSEWGMYKTYPWWIAKRNSMTLVNEAQNGTTMHDNGDNAFSADRYKKIPLDADYITLMFGLNEGSATIGELTDTTTDTVIGAWNVVLEYLITNIPYAKIGIIIADGWINKGMYEALISVAQYWGVPCLDLKGDDSIPLMTGGRWVANNLNTKAQSLRDSAFTVSNENGHPNLKAHEYRSTVIENWLRSL